MERQLDLGTALGGLVYALVRDAQINRQLQVYGAKSAGPASASASETAPAIR
ncbi:MAG: hypothetical protein R3B09_26800 [Nannocystaceae bacterium]